ncbi:MAG: glutamate--tRNA ligase [Thermoplasmata archaeon]|nr:glutamate--tRNA ligase [Thermoplasmata archaeon]
MDESVKQAVRNFALQNAVQHGGKADRKAVMGRIASSFPELKSRIKEMLPEITEIVEAVNALSHDQQIEELQKTAPELLQKERKEKGFVLPELPDVKGTVVMRLAPFPSGAPHIGNARSFILNDEYVRKYNGRLYLVFDDTIGSEEKIPQAESYDLIRESLAYLGIRYEKEFFKSDRMEIFYDWARKIIEKGYAYVCHCDAPTLRKYREEGRECEHRNQSVEENLEKWEKMLANGYPEGGAILRIKTDMQHRNPAFRDRVLFRITGREHPRVGSKYNVWPLLEFSWAVDDHLLGITHVLRGKDLMMEDMMEQYIWEIFGIKGPVFLHYGMLMLSEMKLSKSKSMKEVLSGTYTGWDDPRTWSLLSLRRRGIQPGAIRNFITSFGVSLADIEVPAENLYAENRKIVDGIAPRYFFVQEPVRINLNLENPVELELQNHPVNHELGKRKLTVETAVFIPKSDFEEYRGKEIRLKDFCNIVCEENATVTAWENRNIPRIQWVPCNEFVNMVVVHTDGSPVKGVAEKNLANANVNDIVQLERYGFVRIDAKGEAVKAYFGHR